MSGHGSFNPLGAAAIERAVSAVEADERLLGLMLGGSSLGASTDRFSNLDLVVVARDDGHASALAEATGLADKLGPLLVSFTGEHVGEPRLLICLFGPPLLHVDLKFVALSDLAVRVEDPAVLWERTPGLLSGAMAASDAEWPTPELQWLEDRFWVWVHYTAAKIGRGELYEALDALAAIRRVVLGPMLAQVAGWNPQGARRIERYEGEFRANLEATVAGLSATNCARALEASANVYRTLRDRLDDGSLIRRTEAERLSLAYLEEM